MKPALPTAFFAATLLLPSCLENEEEIEIYADGSVRVELSVEGHVHDLAGGYAVPLHGPWIPSLDATTQKWLREVGDDTGRAGTRDRVRRVDWPKRPDERQARIRLSSAATFASVEDWPQTLAPADETYRDAYLRRSAHLQITRRGQRNVYEFTRTYHGAEHARQDVHARAQARIPNELLEKLDSKTRLTAPEWELVQAIAREEYAGAATRFVRAACLGLYTDGDATLAPDDLDAICQQVRDAVSRTIDLREFIEFWNFAIDATEEQIDAIDAPDPIETLDERARTATRDAFATALAATDLDPESRNGIRFALESGFTAFDHATDLTDEKFHVKLRMPGRIVGGNYDRIEEDRAVWTFEGRNLNDRDRVLRAVSVDG